MEETRSIEYAVFQRRNQPGGGTWGENRVLIRIDRYNVRAITFNGRSRIFYEKFARIATKGFTVQLSRLRRMLSSPIDRDEYTPIICRHLSSLGIRIAELQSILVEKLSEAAAAAVSNRDFFLCVLDITYLDTDGDGIGHAVGEGVIQIEDLVIAGHPVGEVEDLLVNVDSTTFKPHMFPVSKSSIHGSEPVTLDDITHTPECAICLENFTAGGVVVEPITRLPCKHQYHVHCIVQWLEFSHLCPLCRSPIKTEEDDRSN